MEAAVSCHSGHTYAERPLDFTVVGRYYTVEQIVSEWRAPDGKHFLVRTDIGQSYTLTYNEGEDRWTARPYPDAAPASPGETAQTP